MTAPQYRISKIVLEIDNLQYNLINLISFAIFFDFDIIAIVTIVSRELYFESLFISPFSGNILTLYHG